jgi:hypothetical protein
MSNSINKHSRFNASILDEFLVEITCHRDIAHTEMVTHGEYDRRVEVEAGCDQCREVARVEGAQMDAETTGVSRERGVEC